MEKKKTFHVLVSFKSYKYHINRKALLVKSHDVFDRTGTYFIPCTTITSAGTRYRIVPIGRDLRHQKQLSSSVSVFSKISKVKTPDLRAALYSGPEYLKFIISV